MTDPRLAPLAAALYRQLSVVPGPPWAELTPEAQGYWLRDAGAILVLLPPDWCGHDPTLYVQVADLTERLGAAETQIDRQAAEAYYRRNP